MTEKELEQTLRDMGFIGNFKNRSYLMELLINQKRYTDEQDKKINNLESAIRESYYHTVNENTAYISSKHALNLITTLAVIAIKSFVKR